MVRALWTISVVVFFFMACQSKGLDLSESKEGTHVSFSSGDRFAKGVNEPMSRPRVSPAQGFDYIFYEDEPMRHAYSHLKGFASLKADELADALAYRNDHPEFFALTDAPSKAVRPMVEWEPMQAIFMQVPHYLSGYTNAGNTIAQIAVSALSVADVWFVVGQDETKANLKSHLLDLGVSSAAIALKVKFFETSVDSVWAIDFGPLPLIDEADNTYAFADFLYYPERYLDDALPTLLGRALEGMGQSQNTVTYRMPLKTEGGNFQATSDGVCFTSSRQLFWMGIDEGVEDESLNTMPLDELEDHPYALEVKDVWGEYAGCKDVLFTHAITDDGTGHLDMYLKVVDDHTVLIGEYLTPYENAAQQTNAYLLEQSAAFVEAYTKPNGGKFEVKRMVMPGHRSTNNGLMPFTYINSTFINGLNLWPAYTFSDWIYSRTQAQATWESVMPDYQHIWIDAEELSFWSGAIHCITRTIPDLTPGLWVADGECVNGNCEAAAGGYEASCHPGISISDACWGPEWLCECNDCDTCGQPTQIGCGGISYEGCCDGDSLYYCEAGSLNGGNCGNGCGWDSSGSFYNCGMSGAEPTGTYPISCDAQECIPSCVGKDCGDDGCGEQCGSCDPSAVCSNGICTSGADPCEGLSYQGCCDSKTLKYCEDDVVKGGECQSSCGWNDGSGFYDCGYVGQDASGTYPLACDEGACASSCNGKECGGDGCGGSCGACDGTDVCSGDGQCLASCQPDCGGKECGDDGCGGSCGGCGATGVCEGGVCSQGSDPCGGITYQGCCDGSTVIWCEANQLWHDDCDTSCGWNAGMEIYDCEATGADPSGVQPYACLEICTPDCAGKQCGDDGCGGSCGDCTLFELCGSAGLCEPYCVPDCNGKECGDDGCGSSCGSCAGDETCQSGTCAPAEDPCGGISTQGCCSGTTVFWCADGALNYQACAHKCGWDSVANVYRCGFSGSDPSGLYPQNCDGFCPPDCDDKECGSDGCGGSCGECAGSDSCGFDGLCLSTCMPDCLGKACGEDGCGGFCGVCATGEICDSAGQCVSNCVADCVDKECGDDGCSGSCGGCALNQACSDAGICVDPGCVPQCAGKACGDDGCGGSCGLCSPGHVCDATGQCSHGVGCTPQCDGKACGDDGCGGTCGLCLDPEVCGEHGLCAKPTVDASLRADNMGSVGTAEQEQSSSGSSTSGCTVHGVPGSPLWLLMSAWLVMMYSRRTRRDFR